MRPAICIVLQERRTSRLGLDPDEGLCPECDTSLSGAARSGLLRYRVVKQPQQPTFDPLAAHGPFDVFISYRHAETNRPATDLYYFFSQIGRRPFLDNGDIDAGVNYESTFLKAASSTKIFVALASRTYFSSPFCRKEIAHALRENHKVIPLEIETTLAEIVPPEMSWLVNINPSHVNGGASGLTPELEEYLRAQLQPGASISGERAFQRSACIHLLKQLGMQELLRIVNNFPWMDGVVTSAPKNVTIRAILDEAGSNPERLQQLSASLRPT